MASAGCIYILREREFIKTNENIYKIGRTSKTILERFRQYPKNSELINSFNVSDTLEYENLAISEFSKLFIRRNDIGKEYFEGDIRLMDDTLYNICIFKNKNINETNNTTTVTNDYYVLPFGQEDNTFITKEDIIVLLNSKVKCIEEYIKLVHLNPKHTKNYNLCAHDEKFNLIKSWDGTKWIFKQPEEMNIAIFKAVFNLIEKTAPQFRLKIPIEILEYHKTMSEYEKEFESYNKISSNKERQILKQLKAIMTILYNKKEEVAFEHAVLRLQLPLSSI
jgi:hypothetical protein